MAHLWIRDSGNRWAVVVLEPSGLTLDDRVLCRRDRAAAPIPPFIRLAPAGDDDRDGWIALAPRGVLRVNGSRVASGLCVLRHRDQISVPGFEAVYFSTERPASIEPCPASERPLKCPRCQQEIGAATPAVCCPACGVWHHESSELHCWTYAESCALCPHPTDLDAGFQWTPDDL
jgi:hypothetical protein